MKYPKYLRKCLPTLRRFGALESWAVTWNIKVSPETKRRKGSITKSSGKDVLLLNTLFFNWRLLRRQKRCRTVKTIWLFNCCCKEPVLLNGIFPFYPFVWQSSIFLRSCVHSKSFGQSEGFFCSRTCAEKRKNRPAGRSVWNTSNRWPVEARTIWWWAPPVMIFLAFTRRSFPAFFLLVRNNQHY